MTVTLDDHKRKVLAAVSIADVVGQHVELRRAGSRLKGLCPFHSEKTPSFTVAESEGFYYCFGCHAGGDAIKFLCEVEGVDFMGALRRLSEMARIPMPELRATTDEDRARRSRDQDRRETMLRLHEEAAGFFRRAFERSPEARAYAAQRGLTDEAIAAWRIGYAPAEWSALCDWARRAGFDEGLLVEGGLAVRHEEKRSVYDRFRNRLVFPICDPQGRAIAFGARAIRADDEPKYINSPETPIYKKSETLFGLHLARTEMRKQDAALLLEGYMDVIGLWQAGFHHAIASCGTAFTPQHARALSRLVDKVYFVYDGDAAGQKAMIAATPSLLAEELTVAVVGLPAEHDPDSLVRERGAEAFGAAVAKARDAFEYFLAASRTRNGTSTVEGRVHIAEELLPLLASVRHPLARRQYLDRLADAASTTPNILLERIREMTRERPPGAAAATAVQPLPAPSRPATLECPDRERALLRVMIERVDWRERLGGEIAWEWISTEAVRRWLLSLGKSELAGPAATNRLIDTACQDESEAVFLRELVFWRSEEFAPTSLDPMLPHLTRGLRADYLMRRKRRLAEDVADPDHAAPGEAFVEGHLASQEHSLARAEQCVYLGADGIAAARDEEGSTADEWDLFHAGG